LPLEARGVNSAAVLATAWCSCHRRRGSQLHWTCPRRAGQ